MALEEFSEQKKCLEWKKENNSAANVTRKFGIMKWNQSPGRRWKANILSR